MELPPLANIFVKLRVVLVPLRAWLQGLLLDELLVHPLALLEWCGPHVHTEDPRSVLQRVVPELLPMLFHFRNPPMNVLSDGRIGIPRPFDLPGVPRATARSEALALVALDPAMMPFP